MNETIRAIEADTTPNKYSQVASRINGMFTTAKNWRVNQDKIHMEALRNFQGEYGPESAGFAQRSRVFAKKTRTKVMTAYARLLSLMFPPSGFAWDIAPTALPESVLGRENYKALAGTPDGEEMSLFNEAMKAKAVGMRDQLQDYMDDMRFQEVMSTAIIECPLFGTMVLQGPLTSGEQVTCWEPYFSDENTLMGKIRDKFKMRRDQEYRKKTKNDLRPILKHIPLLHFYPDPRATGVDSLNYVIIRHVMTRAQVAGLIDNKEFDGEEVLASLKDNLAGNWTPEPWESTVDQVTDKNGSQNVSGNFTVLEAWLRVSGRDLKSMGLEGVGDTDLDNETMYLMNAWTIGGHAIKVKFEPNGNARLPFYIVPYERMPFKIFGRGIAEMCFESQRGVNASLRCVNDNAGCASGPQVIVDVKEMINGDKIDAIRPWAVHYRKGNDTGGRDPMDFKVVPSILPDLLQVLDVYSKLMEEETSMPDMLSGMGSNQGSGIRTLGQQQMLFGSADAYTKSVYFNVDTCFTMPWISSLYDWEMEFGDNKGIKGDMKVVVTGLAGEIEKERRAQKMIEILQYVANDGSPWAPYINKTDVLTTLFRDMGLYRDGVVNSQAEVEAFIKKQQEAMEAAQNEQIKVKAAVPPSSAMLEVLKHTPYGTPMYPEVLAGLAQMYQFDSPEMQQALVVLRDQTQALYSMDDPSMGQPLPNMLPEGVPGIDPEHPQEAVVPALTIPKIQRGDNLESQ